MNNLEQAAKYATLILAEEEGFEEKAYKDIAGIWTCGFGDTEGVDCNTKWSLEEATRRLKVQVDTRLAKLLKVCPKLSQMTANQVASVISLSYNIGTTAFANSSVCKNIMVGEFQTAEDCFIMWNKARVNGVLVSVKGLTNRRIREAGFFGSGYYKHNGKEIKC